MCCQLIMEQEETKTENFAFKIKNMSKNYKIPILPKLSDLFELQYAKCEDGEKSPLGSNEIRWAWLFHLLLVPR